MNSFMKSIIRGLGFGLGIGLARLILRNPIIFLIIGGAIYYNYGSHLNHFFK